MTLTTEIGSTALPDLIKQIRAGNEVLLTDNSEPVARLVPAREPVTASPIAFRVRALKGHRVLTAGISQSDIAEDLFSR